ncbi:hypothetical protein ACMXYN_15025 [Neptuniibacter sp. PT8_73]|uniref:hypothetical protein n=1 Tax=Neptuniibacter sp. PT8_73 TaxID=3398206 RepID=UPI0039F578B7
MKRPTIPALFFESISTCAEKLEISVKDILHAGRNNNLQIWVDKSDHAYSIRGINVEYMEATQDYSTNANGYPNTHFDIDGGNQRIETGYSLVHPRDLSQLINHPEQPCTIFQFQDPSNIDNSFILETPTEILVSELIIKKEHLYNLAIPATPQQNKESYIKSICHHNLLPSKIYQACVLYFAFFYDRQTKEQPSEESLIQFFKLNPGLSTVIQLSLITRLNALCFEAYTGIKKTSQATLNKGFNRNLYTVDFSKLPKPIQATIDVYYEFWSHSEIFTTRKYPSREIIADYLKEKHGIMEGRKLKAIISIARPSHASNKPPKRSRPFITRSDFETATYHRMAINVFGLDSSQHKHDILFEPDLHDEHVVLWELRNINKKLRNYLPAY